MGGSKQWLCESLLQNESIVMNIGIIYSGKQEVELFKVSQSKYYIPLF